MNNATTTILTIPKKANSAPQIVIGLIIAAATVVGIYFGIQNMRGSGKETPVVSPGVSMMGTGSDGTGSGSTAAPAAPAPGSSVAAGTPSTSVCSSAQMDALSSSAALNIWKATYIAFIDANKADLTNVTLADITSKQAAIDSMAACLAEQSASINTIQTTNANLFTQQTNLQAAIEQRQTDIQIAQDRALLALDPNYNRTYYDGWFPMTRPLRESTVPVLIGFSLFFTSMSFLSILAFAGGTIKALLPGARA